MLEQLVVARRDRPVKDKAAMPRAEFVAKIVELLGEMQAGLLGKARAFRDENTRVIESRADFEDAAGDPDDGEDGLDLSFEVDPAKVSVIPRSGIRYSATVPEPGPVDGELALLLALALERRRRRRS